MSTDDAAAAVAAVAVYEQFPTLGSVLGSFYKGSVPFRGPEKGTLL